MANELESQVSLELVLSPLSEIESKVKASLDAFNAILVKLPQGAITDKAATGIIRRLAKINIVNNSVVKFLNKKNQTLTKRVTSAATKEQKATAKLAKAEARIKKEQERIEKMKTLTGNGK